MKKMSSRNVDMMFLKVTGGMTVAVSVLLLTVCYGWPAGAFAAFGALGAVIACVGAELTEE